MSRLVDARMSEHTACLGHVCSHWSLAQATQVPRTQGVDPRLHLARAWAGRRHMVKSLRGLRALQPGVGPFGEGHAFWKEFSLVPHASQITVRPHACPAHSLLLVQSAHLVPPLLRGWPGHPHSCTALDGMPTHPPGPAAQAWRTPPGSAPGTLQSALTAAAVSYSDMHASSQLLHSWLQPLLPLGC